VYMMALIVVRNIAVSPFVSAGLHGKH